MTYFNDCNTLDELKKAYRRLAMIHHPDRGGDLETMKHINAEYERKHDELLNGYNSTHSEQYQKHETAAEFIRIIEELMKIDGLDIELCGAWLWIGGNTRDNKDALKACGCKWASKKKLWYWHPHDAAPKHARGNKSMAYIRNKYGSEKITNRNEDIMVA